VNERPWQRQDDDGTRRSVVDVIVLTALLWPIGLWCCAAYAQRARRLGEREADYWVAFLVTTVILLCTFAVLA
jgi:hypothetical protein